MKRILALITALLLCVSLLPSPAQADGEEEAPVYEEYEPAVTVLIPEPEPPAPAPEPQPEPEPEPETPTDPTGPEYPAKTPDGPGAEQPEPAEEAETGGQTASEAASPSQYIYYGTGDEDMPPPAPGSTYVINGVSVSYTDFPSMPKGCWTYANDLYGKIWGVHFDNEFYSPDNMLRELSDEDLTLTVEHLKEYVAAAALGSTIRVCEERYLHGTDGWGHSVVLVDWDEDGFTVLEGGFDVYPYCFENHYSWEFFVSAYNDGKGYEYIKYIKWPDAEPYILCDVALDANGGACSAEAVTVRGNCPLGELPAPVRMGWEFEGWYDAPEGGERYDEDDEVSADVTLYARWDREHDWGDWIISRAPAYAEPGEEYRICFWCSEKETRLIPPLAPTVKMAVRARLTADPQGNDRVDYETATNVEQ